MNLSGASGLTFTVAGSLGSTASGFFAYICTKTTADPFVAPRAISLMALSQDVADGFYALQGGRFEVGKLAFYPIQRSVANHLLCDGREVRQADFPELYAYLGDSMGASSDPLNFRLPNYLVALVPASAAVVETVNEGTVSTPEPAVPPPTYYPEKEDKAFGGVDSGGRYRSGTEIP